MGQTGSMGNPWGCVSLEKGAGAGMNKGIIMQWLFFPFCFLCTYKEADLVALLMSLQCSAKKSSQHLLWDAQCIKSMETWAYSPLLGSGRQTANTVTYQTFCWVGAVGLPVHLYMITQFKKGALWWLSHPWQMAWAGSGSVQRARGSSAGCALLSSPWCPFCTPG